jgi:hypothetical protein
MHYLLCTWKILFYNIRLGHFIHINRPSKKIEDIELPCSIPQPRLLPYNAPSLDKGFEFLMNLDVLNFFILTTFCCPH